MKTNSILVAAMLLIAGAQALCQTKMIAHRSHSGSIQSFSADGEDNWGIAPRRMDSVLRLTDTSAIEFSNYGIDTVSGDPFMFYRNAGLDSLQMRFPKVKFLGFDSLKAPATPPSHPGTKRRTSHSEIMPGTSAHHHHLLLLAVLGVIAVPLIARRIWNAETTGKG